MLKQGTRYRLTFHNRTDDAHPLHLHRHQLEIAEIYGKATSGVTRTRWWCRLMAAPAWTLPPTSRDLHCFIAISSSIWITGSKRCCGTPNRKPNLSQSSGAEKPLILSFR